MVDNSLKLGSWYIMGKSFYVVVNTGGTVEMLPKPKWYKTLWLEILECVNKPMGLDEIREFVRGE